MHSVAARGPGVRDHAGAVLVEVEGTGAIQNGLVDAALGILALVIHL